MSAQKATITDAFNRIIELLSSFDPNITIAATAVIIALITAIFTAYQAFLQRRHNRLSVKPHLTTWIDEDKNDGFYRISCDLLNNGIGPAIIKRFEVYYEGQKIGDNTDRKALEAAIKTKIEEQEGIIRNKVSVIGLDFPFLPGTRETLLEIQTPTSTNFDETPFQEFVEKFDANFVYHSMYGEKFTHSTKNDKDKA